MIGGVEGISASDIPAWNIETGKRVEITDVTFHLKSDTVLLSPDQQITTEVWIDDSSRPIQGNVRLIAIPVPAKSFKSWLAMKSSWAKDLPV
ncbi:MAG: hypothetical protein JXB38_18710 [Anaerolineales bacterium]|nr:hypothetical protein [Anaerolineales bacterium]